MMPGRESASTTHVTVTDGEGRIACRTHTINSLFGARIMLREAVEAPRLWTMGAAVEMEPGFDAAVRAAMAAHGHGVVAVPHVAGGICAIAFHPEGMEGAACGRADGSPAALAGGWARPGVRFRPDAARG